MNGSRIVGPMTQIPHKIRRSLNGPGHLVERHFIH